MQESLIRKNLNELEKCIVYFNKEKVISKKIFYADKIAELLFQFKTVTSKMTEDEIKQIQKIIKKTKVIFETAYSKSVGSNENKKTSKENVRNQSELLLDELEELRLLMLGLEKSKIKITRQLKTRISKLKKELKEEIHTKSDVF